MAETESRLRFTASDQTGAAFASIANRLRGIEQQSRRANEGITRQYGAIERSLIRSAQGMAGFTRQFGVATGGYLGGRFVSDSIRQFAETDRALTRVGITAGASKEQMAQAAMEIRRIADATGQSTTAIREGLNAMVVGGVSFEDSMKMLPQIAAANQALGAEMKETADSATVLMQTMKIAPADMGKAFDMIAVAANEAKFEAKDLAMFLPQIAATAATMNMQGTQGLSRVLAMLEIAREGTGTAGEAVTGVRDLLSRATQGDLLAKFQEHGVNLEQRLDEARRAGADLSGVYLGAVEDALSNIARMKNMPEELKHGLVGYLFPERDSRQAATMMMLLKNRALDIERATRGASGTIGGQLNRVVRDLQSELDRAGNAWEGIKTSFGRGFEEGGGLDGIRQMTDAMNALAEVAERAGTLMGRVSRAGSMPEVMGALGDAAREGGSAAAVAAAAEARRAVSEAGGVGRISHERAARRAARGPGEDDREYGRKGTGAPPPAAPTSNWQFPRLEPFIQLRGRGQSSLTAPGSSTEQTQRNILEEQQRMRQAIEDSVDEGGIGGDGMGGGEGGEGGGVGGGEGGAGGGSGAVGGGTGMGSGGAVSGPGARMSPDAPGGPARRLSPRRGGGGAAGGGGGGAPLAVPDVGPMTDEERNNLGLILKYESNYKNTMNYMGKRQGLDPTTAKGYTAQGYYQMLNSNWRRLAPKLGIGTPNAMASSLEDQTKVALALMRERPGAGVGHWRNFNPALRAALARGERANVARVPNIDRLSRSPDIDHPESGGREGQRPGPGSSLDDLKAIRDEARKPIALRFEGGLPAIRERGALQARREISREMRDARYNAYSDVGVA